ncbi:MAG: NTP transferase domain-containing protein [Ignavibacteriales bacterium]|nr:NTP transferase domain-containing protein [Ignavibacteriales bacterium]
MRNINNGNIFKLAKENSSPFRYGIKETAIILAAGHGKRIRSQRSKMLHMIWEKPTILRVHEACSDAIKKINIAIVVGIKAEDVISSVGRKSNTCYIYQEEQRGTGHAVQVALKNLNGRKYSGIVYVIPGDMGLIDQHTIKMFKKSFIHSGADMMVLTGIYTGEKSKNTYGRIIRVKSKDINGKSSGKDFNKVIEILEHKDILGLPTNKSYEVEFNKRKYSFSKRELLNIDEFNSGVYAFKFERLTELIDNLKSNNVQKEIYITDLISLFNRKGYTVCASSPHQQHVLMGFNNKSVLAQMESIARQIVYEKIKDIIEIDDPEDFFIDDDVVKDILKMDKKGKPLDIKIGKGVYIGKGVKLNYNLTLKKNVYVNGNVIFNKNVTVWENVHLSCFENQRLVLKENVEILWGNIIKGNIFIGKNSRIESSVNMTGSDEYPMRVGENVTIKGTSYVFGSIIDDDVFIEHSVLIKKKINKLIKRNNEIQKVRFFLPLPSGIDAIDNLK